MHMRMGWLLLIVTVVALTGCVKETTRCDGFLVAGTCHPCPGTMVDGVCISDSPECNKDDDCLPIAVCLGGTCGQECTRSDDCPGGGPCVLYRCEGGEADVLSDATGTIPCDKHIDCDQYDMACINGFCDRECTKTWHCEGADVICEGYMCKSSGQVQPDVVDPQDGGKTDTLLPGCEPTDGPYGAACSCKQECATGLCVQNSTDTSAMCTQYCQNAAQCPGPDICVKLTEASVCALNDSGQPTSCDPDQVMCLSGIYLTNKLGDCACTTLCKKVVDCPDGYGCHLVGTDKVCVSTGEACGDAYNPCYGECAGDPQTGVGFCTNICITSTDCPEGWTCQPLGGGVSVCASPY
jgi:hypothetical protein